MPPARDIAIDYTHDNWVENLLELTGGRKARVVYESLSDATPS